MTYTDDIIHYLTEHGGRWTVGELAAGLPWIPVETLRRRLRALAAAGILDRHYEVRHIDHDGPLRAYSAARQVAVYTTAA